ncbi:MAG: carboxypeptidase regulatory-like domain-containing protein [Bryobacteraceae bacterium]|nr:carboxypeptidase regulatory-like domain-containing protein [Bryobacteraceae bacterium]
MRHRSLSFTFAFLALLLLAVPAFSQGTGGGLAGTIYDPSGSILPGAKVTITNVATNVTNTVASDSQGRYEFINIPAGIYRVTVEVARFTPATVENVDIQLNRIGTVNVTLQPGTVQESIVVTGAAPQVDTTTPHIASNYSTRLTVELPQASFASQGGVLFGAYNLALLSAGVSSSGGVGQGRGPSVGGQRPTNNNFTIEGVDNNDKSITGPLVYVPNEATQEFTLLQNQYSPEWGHSSGGQFNTSIRAGTNDFHGALYNYLQNRNLNAVDESFKRQGIFDNPRYDQNRLGAALGGPIKRNRMFFFANFEYIPLGLASTPSSATYAPTAEGFAALGNIAGVSRTNLDVLRQYLAAAPTQSEGRTTSVGGVAIPIGILPIEAPNYQNQYVGVGSWDYNVTDRDQIRARFVYNDTKGINSAANLNSFFTDFTQLALLGTVNYNRTFTPSLFNELRVNYNRFNQQIPAGSFAFPGLDQFPNIEIQQDLNLQLGPQPEAPQFSIYNTYQVVDNVSWNRGGHNFRFGFDGRRIIAPQSFVQRSRGDYGYSSLENFLFDITPDLLAQRSVGAAPYSGDQWNLYWYANDNWRIRPNLTLNLGLRYEYITIPQGIKLQQLNQAASVPGLLEFREPKAQNKNFAPRVGIVYSPGTSGRTSIRAGFGLAYDQIYDNLNILSLPPQFNTTIDVTGAGTGGFLAGGGIPGNALPDQLTPEDARAFTASWVPDQLRPYSIQWNFGIQQSLGRDWAVEARYLGTRGVHLPTQNIINRQARATPGRSLPTFLQQPSQAELDALPLTLADLQALPAFRPEFTAAGFQSPITSFLPNGNSIYHGLALEANRRFAQGLQAKIAYTWSRNIDDSTASLFSTLLTPRRPQDFYNMEVERATSALDRRHRLTITPLWETPFFRGADNWLLRNLIGNWTLAGTYTYESPQFATVQSGLDSNLNGDSAPDRAVVNPAGQAGTGSGVTALTNSGGQVVGYLANNPNARYITAGAGVFPNAGRNTLEMNPINNVDLSVQKNFNITERWRINFRADAYNAFNHAQYTPGQINNIALTSRTATRNFLIPSHPDFNRPDLYFESNSRVLQLALRVIF